MQSLPESLKPKAAKYIQSNAEWTVYNLAAHLGVKARDIYLPLDQHTRLMLIKEGRLLPIHSTEGLYPLAEKYETYEKFTSAFRKNETDTPTEGA